MNLTILCYPFLVIVVILMLILAFGGLYVAIIKTKIKEIGERNLMSYIILGIAGLVYIFFYGGFYNWLFSCKDLVVRYLQ